MDKEVVIQLLRNIATKKYVGVAGFEAITIAIENGLVERTEIGNFKLTPRGLDLLKETSPGDVF